MIYMDVGMRNWISRTAKQHLWRVNAWYSHEELVADGYLCYAKCRAKYKQFPDRDPTREQRKHFMSLVQRTYCNHIHSLAKQRMVEEPLALDWDKSLIFWEDPFFQLLMKQLPMELVDVATVLLEDTSDYVWSRRRECSGDRVRLRKKAIRETTQQHIGRLLDRDPQVDFLRWFSNCVFE